MAVVTRYFSTASAGAGDGTTWADRAALFSAGAWSTVITGFNFTAATDSLKCLIGPGTYTITVTLASGLFTSGAPAVAVPLLLHGCDSSGVQLSPPDPDWFSNQPAWDDSGLPVLATTTNISTVNLANAFYRLLKFTASGRNSFMIQSANDMDWCSFLQSTNNASAVGVVASRVRNSVISMTGANYAAGTQMGNSSFTHNVRVSGVTGSGGNRNGFEWVGSTGYGDVVGLTSVGHGGSGVSVTSASTGVIFSLARSTIANNGGDGIKGSSTASQTNTIVVSDSLVTGNGGFGVNAQSAARMLLTHNRFRDNTSGATGGTGNYPTDLDSYTTDSDDATEFVNAGSGDYRIKNTAVTWGQGYGVSDEPAASSGGAILSRVQTGM